jgi:phosphomannomutase
MPIDLPGDLVTSVSGFRGRVGSSMTPELVSALGAAFGAFLRDRDSGGRILVGRDSRTSGEMLARGAIAGLQSVGCHVVDLGMVPTPTLLLAVEEGSAAGGVAVTASHNPAEWNALKFASSEGMFLDPGEMTAFREFLAEGAIGRASWDALGEVEPDDLAIDRHLQRVLEVGVLDLHRLHERGFRVALDCVRGAGGRIMPRLLESLGCEVVGIGLEPDGRFPRDPEPTAANLADLVALVKESDADLGIAVDPDVDRLSLVDESGVALGEDLTLALACAVVLRRTPGPVVTNLSTSQVVDDVARAFGVPVMRAPVGEIHVARRMQREGALIGGEGNGGVILAEVHFTRDAPLGAALILQHLLVEGRPLSEAARQWPPYRIVKEKMSYPREALQGAYDALEEDLSPSETDRSDGLWMAWPLEGRWLHVRPSGTEPVVRLIAESRNAGEATALVGRARDLLLGVR